MVGVAVTPTIHLPYTYHTPTILLPSLLLPNLLGSDFSTIEIFQQNKDFNQISHLSTLRVEIATIKGKNIFLGRENFLAGQPEKLPSLSVLYTQQKENRHKLRNIFTSLEKHSSETVGTIAASIVGVW